MSVPRSPAPEIPAGPAHLVSWLTAHPDLVVAGLCLGAGLAVAAGAGVRRWRHARLARHAHLVQILPPPEVEATGASTWWATVTRILTPAPWQRALFGTPHVVFEYRWTGRQATISVWVPGTVSASTIAAAARAAWPGATTTLAPATQAPAPIPLDAHESGAATESGALIAARPTWYPLAERHETDPTRALMTMAAGLHGNETSCVQILARPTSPRRLARARAEAGRAATAPAHAGPAGGLADPLTWVRGALGAITDLLTPRTAGPHAGARATRLDPVRDRQVRAGIDKLTGPHVEIAIRYAATVTPRTPSPVHGPSTVAGSASGDRSARSTGRTTAIRPVPASTTGCDEDRAGRSEARRTQGLVSRRETTQVARRRATVLAHGLASSFGVHAGANHLRRIHLHQPAQVLAARRLRRGFLVSLGELAALATLPTDLAVPGLDRARAKAVPAPIAVPAGGRGMKVLGRAEAGGHAVALPVADARSHLHVLGSTGSGKSTLLAHLILADIRAGRGLALIDPKGDLATFVLAHLDERARRRLVLIDPDTPGGATFNPLVGPDADLVVDNVISIFSKIFAKHWGPRIDDVLRVACLTVMRHPNPTLALIPPLLNDKQFRAPFTVDLDDPAGLRGFWEWYDTAPAALRAQVIAPVLARLRSFLLRDFVRATIGVPRSSFDMNHVLDGGILIARLPKGQLGEETAKLLGSFVFAAIWQAATARAHLPEAARRDATVVIDEAHNVLNLAGSVTDMLAEARGYHLGLVLAHQNLTQLPRETQLALSANARNKIYFTCSPEDAVHLAKHTGPHLDEHDLASLDAYVAATRLVIANRETAAFTMRTNPPSPLPDPTRLQGPDQMARNRHESS